MSRVLVPILVSAAAACAAARLVAGTALGVRAGPILCLVLMVAAAVAAWLRFRSDADRLAGVSRAVADRERRYQALFEACGDAVFAFELHDGRPGRFVAANEAACMSLGYPRQTLLAMTCDELFAPEARRGVLQRMRALREAGSLAFEGTFLASDGHRLPVELSLRRADSADQPLCLAVARDLSAGRELVEVADARSHTDELTGLLGRRGFFVMVGEARQRARRLGAQVLVLHAELKGLHEVNDELGHAAGDALVLAAADVLRLSFRDSDVVARLGGDEFAALAVLSRSDCERIDWQTIVARFDEAAAAKRAELAGEFTFALNRSSRVATWDELDDIDGLLRSTRRCPATPRPRLIGRRADKVLAER
jgi:diguanylate cyclase (GGDEF)-like protein/PAS domain S-box-containing protein